MSENKVYNVVVYCGYVESFARAPIIFQHDHGFNTPKEALLHLNETLVSIINKNIEEGEWKPREKNDISDHNFDLEEFLLLYQSATLDSSPLGYEFWEDLRGYGWDDHGKLVSGICVTVKESGECLLASRTAIENHCDAYYGKYIPYNGYDDWPMDSDLQIDIVTVNSVPKIPVERPSK